MPYQEPERERLVPLGSAVSTHATHGELRVRLFNPTSTAIRPDCTVLLQRNGERREWRVSGVRHHKQQLQLTLDGCNTMAAAQELIGCEVCVREQDLPAPAPSEVYHYELLGMTVVTTAGAEVGRIAEMLVTTSNDVCVVRSGARE
jgi:16S rRNA processing protein RimM